MRGKLKGKVLSVVLCITMLLACLPFDGMKAEASSTPTTLYLTPNSNWTQASARFAAYFFGNGEKWVDMTDSDGDGIYEVEVPSGYPSVIFCRMNPSNTANDWSNKWNQTGDLAIPTDGTNMYTMTAGSWDQGSWSTHTVTTWTPPVTEETMTVVLNPTMWDVGDAWFAIYSYTGEEGVWTAMTEDAGSGLFKATISNQYQYFVFCRMNSASQDLTMSNRWNYSSVLEYPTDGNNMYSIAEVSEWNAGGGTWSQVDPDNLPQKAQPVDIDTLYLYPNAAWLEADARFAVYAFDETAGINKWFNMTDSNGDGIYEGTINQDVYSEIIYVRLDPGVDPTTSANPWGGKWGQTGNLVPLVDGTNLYKLTNGDTGVWATYDDLSDYTVEVPEQTYTGSALTPSVTVKDGDGNTIAASEYDLSYANNKNAGVATVTVAFKNAGAYAGKISKNFTINPASAVIGTVTADVVYDSINPADVVLHRADTTIPGTLEITDDVLTYGNNTYNWKFTPSDSNYAEITGTVVVKVAINSMASGAVLSTYKTSEDEQFTVLLNGNTVKSIKNGATLLVEGEDYVVSENGVITFKASYLDTLNAGEYTLTISYYPQGVDDSEIQLNDSTITLRVAKKTITVSGATADNKAHDGTTSVKVTKVILSGIVTGDEVSADLTSVVGTLSSADAGQYNTVTVSGVTLTGADAANYELAEASYTVATTATIYVYERSESSTTTMTHTYQDSKEASINVLLNGNTVKDIVCGNTTLVADKDYVVATDGTISFKATYLNGLDVGEYLYTISFNPQGIEISGVTLPTVSVKLTVLAKEITVTGATVEDKIYDGTTDVKITEVTLDGVASGDVVTVDLTNVTGKLSGANAGEYNQVTLAGLVLTGADAKNYKLTSESYTVATEVEVKPIVISGISIEPNVTAQVVGKEVVLTVTTENEATLAIKVVHKDNETNLELTKKDGVYTATYTVPEGAEVKDVITFVVYALNGNYVVDSVSTSITVSEAERTPLPAPEPEDGKEYKMEMEDGINNVPDELKNIEDLDTVEEIEDKMQDAFADKSDKITSSNVEVYDVVLKYSDDGETWITADENNFPAAGITVRLPYPEGTAKATHKFIVAHMFTTNVNGKTIGDIEYPSVTLGDDYIEFTVTSLYPISLGWELISSSEEQPGGGNNNDTNDNNQNNNNNNQNNNNNNNNNNNDGNDNQTEQMPATGEGFVIMVYFMLAIAGCGLILVVLKKRQSRA